MYQVKYIPTIWFRLHPFAQFMEWVAYACNTFKEHFHRINSALLLEFPLPSRLENIENRYSMRKTCRIQNKIAISLARYIVHGIQVTSLSISTHPLYHLNQLQLISFLEIRAYSFDLADLSRRVSLSNGKSKMGNSDENRWLRNS